MEEQFRLEDSIEAYRIAEGIRRPPQIIKRTARCQGRHADATCRGCFELIEEGARMVWEEDLNCAIQARRNRYWHPRCHPDRVNREWHRVRAHHIQSGVSVTSGRDHS